MKSKLPVVEFNGVRYQYDIEGKKLISVNNPKQSIALSRLKYDPKFVDFFQPIDTIKDVNQRSIHVIVQKHALMGQKPSKEEQAFLTGTPKQVSPKLKSKNHL